MKDDKLLTEFRKGRSEKAFSRLYKYYPKVEKLIRSKGGTKDDAQDIFQEGLIILYKKVLKPDFELTASLSTYLYSICRLLWSNELRKRKQSEPFDEAISETIDEEKLFGEIQHEQDLRLAESVLQQIGARCLELLKLFYYEALKMREIARLMKFSSEKVAKNQKYKCLQHAKLKLKALRSTPSIPQS